MRLVLSLAIPRELRSRHEIDWYSRRPFFLRNSFPENANTLVFICDIRANKAQIKQVVKDLYNVEVSKVNTLITPAGKKKAFIKLAADYDALEVSNKIGIV